MNRSRTSQRSPGGLPLGALALAALLLSACGTQTSPPNSEGASGQSAAEASPTDKATEAAGPQPRIAVTHDGGVLVLDAESGEVLLDHELPGFNRLSQAGDGRHLMISTAQGFEVLDLGAWTEAHGDHGHSFTAAPHLTGTTYDAQEPGHVVHHDGRTVLFDDGTGTITSFDTAALGDGKPEAETHTTPEPHHGVAVELAGGNLIHTVGDAESATGIRMVTAAGNELARGDCPGVHGEAFAGGVAVFGCEDGVLIVDGRTITKAESPDDYGRIGNQAGSPESPILLGDYKTDPEAELERPRRISLVDTRTARIRLVDVEASYSFRSLGRGPAGEALVLGTDGTLREIDPESGTITARIPVVAPWKEPVEWQEPRPTLLVLDDTAYVSEPATDQLHVVDLGTGKVTGTHDLPVTPNEVNGTPG